MASSSFFQMPVPADVLSAIGVWSSSIFANLLPFALVLAGLSIGAILLLLFWKGIVGAVHLVLNFLNTGHWISDKTVKKQWDDWHSAGHSGEPWDWN